jgi:hypothetical protein
LGLLRAYEILLDIVVEEELIGMWTKVHGFQLMLPFIFDPYLYKIVGEYVTPKEIIVIPFQRVQDLTEGTRCRLDLGGLLGRQVIEILVDGLSWMDLVLDSVQPGHEHGCEREVPVAGGVRRPEFNALGLFALGVHGDTYTGAPVSLGID